MNGGETSAFLVLDLPAALCAVLVANLCAILGCLLLVRRSAMLGDAISHAVLPGIVASFLLTGSRSTPAMLAGAAAAGVATSLLIDLLHRRLRIERSAATGVVFCCMFALGVLMLERGARNVDLDADCVLYGLLEGISWPALGNGAFLIERLGLQGGIAAVLADTPRQMVMLAGALALTLVVVCSLYKVLVLASFDAAMADALGFSSRAVGVLIAALVALCAVASFEAVGSILVVAMLVCPAATARMLSNDLKVRMLIACGQGTLSAVAGYALAIFLPRLWGSDSSLLASGMMVTVSGVILVAVAAVQRVAAATRSRSAASNAVTSA